jgi:hypothetical protein
MVRDMGKVMQARAERNDRLSPAVYSRQIVCTGPCKKRKSFTQFSGASTMCKQCMRRKPKEA